MRFEHFTDWDMKLFAFEEAITFSSILIGEL